MFTTQMSNINSDDTPPMPKCQAHTPTIYDAKLFHFSPSRPARRRTTHDDAPLCSEHDTHNYLAPPPQSSTLQTTHHVMLFVAIRFVLITNRKLILYKF